MKIAWRRSLLVLLLSFVVIAPILYAQLGTATLSGTVVDPSGAVIPGAKVTLQSLTENARRDTVTDSAGFYRIPAILPGTYRLTVSASGFASQTFNNISLTSGQGSTLNVTLAVQTAVARVNVKAAPPLLETTTATVGSTVSANQFTALPMLGRNFTSLIQILPGVVPTPPPDSINTSVGGVSLDPSVFGQRQRSNDFTLDGLPNDEVVHNGVPMFPPPEAIAEMKVQSGSDTGAQGYAAGASINVVTKSGTNAYHGDLWEYVRNNAFNARSFFQTKTPRLDWNQFGFTGGGPLQIPHLVSKSKNWYIFGYYEGVRIPSTSQFLSFYPTQAELNGDFSADNTPIYNPYTTTVNAAGSPVSRQPFPGNIIPAGATTACAPQPSCINSAALAIAKAFYPLPNLAPGVVPGKNFLGYSRSTNNANQYSVRADHQFGQRDSFFARFSESWDSTTSVNEPPAPQFPQINQYHMDNYVISDTHTFSPTMVLTGRFGEQRFNWQVFTGGPDVAKAVGTLAAFPPFHGDDVIIPITIPGYPGIGQGVQIYGPQALFTWSADAQKLTGKHSIGFGGNIWKQGFTTDNLSGTYEIYSTQPTASATGGGGNALASYLLGLPSSAGREIGVSEANSHSHAFALYLQDSYKAARKLTINAGLRWDLPYPFVNENGDSFFLFENGKYYWDKTNPQTGQAANIRLGGVNPDYHDFAPRFGLAYEVTPDTVVRASYGIFFDTFDNFAQTDQGNRGNWPFAFPQAVADLNTTVPQSFLLNPFPGVPSRATTPTGFIQNVNVEPSSTRSPYVNEWSFSLQRAFGSHTTAELDYFGSLGVKLSGQIVDNVAVTPGTNPYQNRQVYPQFAPYVLNGYDELSSWYDGFVAQTTVRAMHNLTLVANYTWSKAMDIEDSLANAHIYGMPFENPTRYNLGLNKGPAGFDMTNVINVSYIYNLPVKTRSRLANAVAGGWSTSGEIHFDSGPPYYVLLPSDNENIGTGNRDVEFPNLVSNPNTGFTQSLKEWFNTAAYVEPPFGTRGYAGRHALYADPESEWDMAIYKEWHFTEDKYLEFRAEFFNFLNSHTFDPAGVLMGTPQFGTISAVRQGGRQMQFALKVHF